MVGPMVTFAFGYSSFSAKDAVPIYAPASIINPSKPKGKRYFRIFKRTRIKYLKVIRNAHKIHHKSRSKDNGTCFGMLIVPLKYWKQA